ncbi:hypothetical protein ACLOJK_000540, partial [Asimina triloba]
MCTKLPYPAGVPYNGTPSSPAAVPHLPRLQQLPTARQPVDGKTAAATTQPPSIQIRTTEQHLPRPIFIQRKQIPISSHGQVETHLVAPFARLAGDATHHAYQQPSARSYAPPLRPPVASSRSAASRSHFGQHLHLLDRRKPTIRPNSKGMEIPKPKQISDLSIDASQQLDPSIIPITAGSSPTRVPP